MAMPPILDGQGVDDEEEGSSNNESSTEDFFVEEEKEEKQSWEESSSSESESELGEENQEGSDSDEDVEVHTKELALKKISRKQSYNSDEDSKDEIFDKQESESGTSRKSGKFWEKDPEVYGIRRSSRARKEPERLTIKQKDLSDSESENGRGRRKKKKRSRLSSDSWPTLTSSDSESSNDYSQKTKPAPKRRPVPGTARRAPQSRKKASYSAGRNTKSSSDDEGERTNPSRRASSKISYKEHSDAATDEDDVIETANTAVPEIPDDAECIEKVLTHRLGWPGVIGDITTMYAAEAPELATRRPPDPKTDTTELHFYIKWKNWAHIHNTWESEKSLTNQKVKGMKKLANYIKRMDEMNNWKRIASPEDVEYFEYQQELHEEILDEYKIVDRIIGHNYNEDNKSSYPDYVCKWQGLPYSEATVEDGSLITRFFQEKIDSYLNRERSTNIPTRSAKVLKQRPKFVQIKKQPSYLGGNDNLQLRDYQLGGINWISHAWCRENSVILADEMGLGKTIQTIGFLSHLFHSYELYGPYLIVVPLSTMAAWQKEFTLWASDMNVVVYIGDVNSRTKIQEYDWSHKNGRLKFNCILTTYEMLLKDKDVLGSVYWAALMVDEAHRLKNDDSLLYRSLVDFRTNFRLLITGTPLQNSLKELWSLLHFIMPDKFPKWEEFELQHSSSDMKDGYQNLHRELEPFLLRRIKKDVEKSLPSKVEQILRIEMSGIQKQYYKWILTKNYKELSRGVKGSRGVSGFLNIVVELKKCCNHANLVRQAEAGPTQDLLQLLIRGSGKMVLLDKLLTRLKERGHRVLIFSQMVRMLDIIADYLALRRFQFQRLDGSIRGDKRKQALDQFNAEGSQDFCFLLSTRAGGLGVNLATADIVIIFDSDWNPQNDLQAMARAHRIGQTKQVKIYRLVTKGSIEEDIIERAKKKMVLDHLIIQRMDTTGKKVLNKTSHAPSASTPFNREELASILKFGAEELFKEGDHEQDQKLEEMDIDDILERAETHDSENHQSTAGDDLLSQFKVANFGISEEAEIEQKVENGENEGKSWDEIIPEVERKKALEEEEQKKRMELYLPPRKRKTVAKMNLAREGKDGKSSSRPKDGSESFSENESGEDADAPKRKRGRPRTVKRDEVEGFNDAEVRRFTKSYKKFARPRTRLDAIAADAELQEKSVAELTRLANQLHDGCENAIKEYEDKLLQDPNFDGKKRGASFKISGVTVNAASILKLEEELEPLAICIPENPEERKQYRLAVPTRSVHWGIKWDVIHDSMLLVGMFQYGIDNWEAIKNDQSLGLSNTILLPGNEKPQDKHLRSRAEYLLKLLKKLCCDNKKPDERKPRPKNKKKKANESKTSTESHVAHPEPILHRSEHHDDSTNSSYTSHHQHQYHVHFADRDDHDSRHATNATDDVDHDRKSKKPKQEGREKKAKAADKEKKGKHKLQKASSEESVQMVNEDSNLTITITEISDMSKEIFTQCKEKMRMVKKALRMLENPEDNLPEKEQVNTTRQCLLKIGDHIQRCLDEYTDTDKSNKWRSNLWTFVSKFTAYDAGRLFKLYRIACRKREEQREEKRKHVQEKKPAQPAHPVAPTQQHQNHPPPHPQPPLHERPHATPNLLELDEVRKRTLGIAIPSPSGKIPKIDKYGGPLKDHRGFTKQQEKRSPAFSRHDDRGHDFNRGHRRKDRSRSPNRHPSEDSYRHKDHQRSEHRHRDERSRDDRYDDRPRDDRPRDDRSRDDRLRDDWSRDDRSYDDRSRDSRYSSYHQREHWERDQDRHWGDFHNSSDSKRGQDSYQGKPSSREKDGKDISGSKTGDYGSDYQAKYHKKDQNYGTNYRGYSDKKGSPSKRTAFEKT